MEITEWVPREVIGVHHVGPVSGTGRFVLTDAPASSTVITWQEELAFPWWLGGAVGAKVARPLSSRCGVEMSSPGTAGWWVNAGSAGPTGPTGPTGPIGLIGSFGLRRRGADETDEIALRYGLTPNCLPRCQIDAIFFEEPQVRPNGVSPRFRAHRERWVAVVPDGPIDGVHLRVAAWKQVRHIPNSSDLHGGSPDAGSNRHAPASGLTFLCVDGLAVLGLGVKPSWTGPRVHVD